MTHTVEDILGFVVSLDSSVLSVDKGILVSIDRQVKRGTALTDRQHELVKTKLLTFRDFLVNAGYSDLETSLETLKYPLRTVDRYKTIELVNDVIEVRFPFNKKTIVVLDQVANKLKKFYNHQRGSNLHTFKCNEVTIETVVDAFSGRNFVMNEELIQLHKKVKEAKMDRELVVPGIYNKELKNFRKSAIEFMSSELGPVTDTNLIKFYDRRRRYGISDINCDNPGGLLGLVAFRETTEVAVDPDMYNLVTVAETIEKLGRFPLVAVIDADKPLEQVSRIHAAFRDIVPNEKQSVLFRVDAGSIYNLNNYVHDNSLNNWLDSNTKIVYINKNKLPKLLLRSDWKPMAALALSSYRANSHVATHLSDMCDLIIYHDKELSVFGKNRRYGNY